MLSSATPQPTIWPYDAQPSRRDAGVSADSLLGRATVRAVLGDLNLMVLCDVSGNFKVKNLSFVVVFRITSCTWPVLSWVAFYGFIDECAMFPNGAHDDQVDAMTQALVRWHWGMVAMEQPYVERPKPAIISWY